MKQETFCTKDVGFAAYCKEIVKKEYVQKSSGRYFFVGNPEEFKQIKVDYINSPFVGFNNTLVLLLRS